MPDNTRAHYVCNNASISVLHDVILWSPMPKRESRHRAHKSKVNHRYGKTPRTVTSRLPRSTARVRDLSAIEVERVSE
jgi:hypothetical protein